MSGFHPEYEVSTPLPALYRELVQRKEHFATNEKIRIRFLYSLQCFYGVTDNVADLYSAVQGLRPCRSSKFHNGVMAAFQFYMLKVIVRFYFVKLLFAY